MMHILPKSNGNILGVVCSGTITKDDYVKILIPAVNRIIAQYGKIRLLFACEDDFSGYELAAMWQDLRYSTRHMRQFERFASINAPFWMALLIRWFGNITSCRCRNFSKNDRSEAWTWIES